MVETSRRREIEDAAGALFRAQGYAATSVRDIARALDIQGASLYAHVTSKHDLLWAIVDRTASRFEDAGARAIRAEAGLGARPAATLAVLVRAHIEVVLDDIESATVFAHEWRSLDPRRREEIVARRDRYETQFRETIARGVADGTFSPVDPTAGASFILTALNGLVTWYSPEGRLRPAAISDSYTALALRAVGQEVRT